VSQAKAAGYNTVHVPLSDDARAAFNESAALAWFETVEGLEYGYQNLLWGWIDTADDGNFPCLPPDYASSCLTFEVLEPLFGVIDREGGEGGDGRWP
jgi:hypothetical protein